MPKARDGDSGAGEPGFFTRLPAETGDHEQAYSGFHRSDP
jgi:hypothetical protein